MKLFLAIFPPKEVLDSLRDVIRHYSNEKRNLKPQAVDQLHITLKYIGGDISQHSADRILQNLYLLEDTASPFKVTFKKLKFGFSKDRFPKILMVDINNSDDLKKLSSICHEFVKDLHLADTIRKKGRFSKDFHITLARLKDTASKNIAKHLKKQTISLGGLDFPSFEVKEIYLVESFFSRRSHSVQYRKLERIPLILKPEYEGD